MKDNGKRLQVWIPQSKLWIVEALEREAVNTEDRGEKSSHSSEALKLLEKGLSKYAPTPDNPSEGEGSVVGG